ncbi:MULTISPECIES: heparan-alpha-glucosaminide N-acetyltransferase domain-containing protein [Collinsella]
MQNEPSHHENNRSASVGERVLRRASRCRHHIYPLIPFSLLYTASATLAWSWQQKGRTYPNWIHREHIPILAWMGRHSLIIYATHQVLLLMVLETVFQ